MSLPEILLWQILRRHPGGVKFRRQHPIGIYTLDFYCAEAKLAIEIDGIAHDMGERPAADKARDLWLKQKGIDILRLAAKDVLADASAAADGLLGLVLSRR